MGRNGDSLERQTFTQQWSSGKTAAIKSVCFWYTNSNIHKGQPPSQVRFLPAAPGVRVDFTIQTVPKKLVVMVRFWDVSDKKPRDKRRTAKQWLKFLDS